VTAVSTAERTQSNLAVWPGPHPDHVRDDEQKGPLGSHAELLVDLWERSNGEQPCDARLFFALCEASSVGIFILQDGHIKYANPALVAMLGRTPEEVVGAKPQAFVHPDDHPLLEASMQRRLRGEAQTSRYEARCLGSQGTVIPVEVFGAKLEQETGISLIGTILDISERKQHEALLHERLRFEQLLAELSATLINLRPEAVNERFGHVLRTLVEFLGNDRTTVFEFAKDGQQIVVTHTYARPGLEPFPLGPLPIGQLPWFLGQIRVGNSVFIRSTLQELPDEAAQERRYCELHGLKSEVAIPLLAGGTVLGGLTFAFLKQECPWSQEIILRLRLIGEVIANALQRQRSDEELRQAHAENEQLRYRLEHENQYLREQVVLKYQHGHIIGQSHALKAVLTQIERVAITDTPVLILGETGTGKELLAQTIHELSSRKKRPMVIVNCASLPATLIESELFGREAGAYTGAASAQVGRFFIADGSTLFLDEIGEFPIELQAKLLRVLQDGRFERLGSPLTTKVNVRIVAATNRNLDQAVNEGRFRADLYHRLNVFPIHVPPLRERREDIPLLAWSFVESIGRRMGKTIKCIPVKTMERLKRYPWPGNVRELSNVIERAMILTADDTLRVDMPTKIGARASDHRTLREIERVEIQRVLEETGWRIRGAGGAAELLDVKSTTLEARMVKLGIKRDTHNSN